jgi:hypothetical protein
VEVTRGVPAVGVLDKEEEESARWKWKLPWSMGGPRSSAIDELEGDMQRTGGGDGRGECGCTLVSSCRVMEFEILAVSTPCTYAGGGGSYSR